MKKTILVATLALLVSSTAYFIQVQKHDQIPEYENRTQKDGVSTTSEVTTLSDTKNATGSVRSPQDLIKGNDTVKEDTNLFTPTETATQTESYTEATRAIAQLANCSEREFTLVTTSSSTYITICNTQYSVLLLPASYDTAEENNGKSARRKYGLIVQADYKCNCHDDLGLFSYDASATTTEYTVHGTDLTIFSNNYKPDPYSFDFADGLTKLVLYRGNSIYTMDPSTQTETKIYEANAHESLYGFDLWDGDIIHKVITTNSIEVTLWNTKTGKPFTKNLDLRANN